MNSFINKMVIMALSTIAFLVLLGTACIGSVCIVSTFIKCKEIFAEPRIVCGDNLIIASKHNYNEIIKSLIKSGCNVNVRNELGLTPFYYAVQNRNYENTKTLLCAGANVNTNKILHEAVNSGDTSIVRIVLNSGADKFARDELGRTPLDIAVQKGYTEIVKIISTNEVISRDFCNNYEK